MNFEPVDFIRAISLNKLRIVASPELIFLCGGSMEGDGCAYGSVRHYIYNFIKKTDDALFKRIVLAEKINDWFKDGIYKDLLTFETDVAGLASSIILFVESPGSIAELGAFSSNNAIDHKTMAFIMEEHYEQDSFIKLGPINYLEDKFESVHVYPWSNNKENNCNKHGIEEYAPEILLNIQQCDKTKTITRKFDYKIAANNVLLICDLINIMLLLKQKEIYNYFQLLKIEVNQNNIERYLFIAEKLGLVRKIAYGNDRYYKSLKDGLHISYAFTQGNISKDIHEWKLKIRNYWKEHDKRRVKAFQHNGAMQQ